MTYKMSQDELQLKLMAHKLHSETGSEQFGMFTERFTIKQWKDWNIIEYMYAGKGSLFDSLEGTANAACAAQSVCT